jgi:hypothetical protein
MDEPSRSDGNIQLLELCANVARIAQNGRLRLEDK